MNLIPHDAYTLPGVPIMVWLGGIGVALYAWYWAWYWWKLRQPGGQD